MSSYNEHDLVGLDQRTSYVGKVNSPLRSPMEHKSQNSERYHIHEQSSSHIWTILSITESLLQSKHGVFGKSHALKCIKVLTI